MSLIALEEHYFDPVWNEFVPASARKPSSPLVERLSDLGPGRLAEMDAAGIARQVLSHSPPGAQGLPPEAAVEFSRLANDGLRHAIDKYPTRFSGFASLPADVPDAAAAELERAVRDLGLCGAMIHGLSDGPFLDRRRYWPIFAKAEELDVPIYIHPKDPHPSVVSAYYADYETSHPMFLRAAWGFTFEAGTQAMRLVLSGVFEAFPRLKVILGHLGETIPFLLTRIDESLARDTPMKRFREVFTRHFYVTTSGFFSDTALECCIKEIGAERVMFSVDWPFVSNQGAADWMRALSLPPNVKRAIGSENAERLLRLDGVSFVPSSHPPRR